MLIVLLIAALLIPPPAFSMTIDAPAATVWLLNSDERIQEVEITAPSCAPCRVAVPLHELISVSIVLPVPAPRCGTQVYDMIVSGVVISGNTELIGASIGRMQTAVLTTTPCPARVFVPLV